MAGMHQHNKVLGASASEALIAGRARRRATDLVDTELPPAALDPGTTLAAPPQGGSEAGGLPPGTKAVLNLVEARPYTLGTPLLPAPHLGEKADRHQPRVLAESDGGESLRGLEGEPVYCVLAGHWHAIWGRC